MKYTTEKQDGAWVVIMLEGYYRGFPLREETDDSAHVMTFATQSAAEQHIHRLKMRELRSVSTLPTYDPATDGDYSEWLAANNID